MQLLVSDSEKVQKAVQHIITIKAQSPNMSLDSLIEDASMRFDLSPLEATSLYRILSEAI